MGDAVTSQTISDGPTSAVMMFTNVSDGTGEAAQAKVDVSALTPAATAVRITRIAWWTAGMSVDLLWDATTDVRIVRLPADDHGDHDFSRFGGIPNTEASGYTGDINFTTVDHTNGDIYVILLELLKVGT